MADDVDLSVLSADEQATYTRLAREAARKGIGGAVAATITYLALTLGLLTISFVALAHDRDGALDDIAGLLTVGVGVLGVPWVLRAFRDAEHAKLERERAASRYLTQIRYHERERRRRLGSGGSGGASDSPTRRQMQHEWYGDHSELTWRDREMGETLGMDSDTYVSNFLENDKD
ncbi:hypothetical protein [Cellulosimicrobium sp. Marseille-Q4280]|uniref:hypothetical protein n=1 Tax=Cellulosimicrobium sp. Marseille-Q4280 TaxID=2937992 RepID=UPI00203FEFF7|nr:hypothetical protein [Cellulosimicrobium sp. Marseille-Q4280]